jgi:hypothetical protein
MIGHSGKLPISGRNPNAGTGYSLINPKAYGRRINPPRHYIWYHRQLTGTLYIALSTVFVDNLSPFRFTE